MGVPIGMVSLHAIATFLRIAFAERIHTTTTAGQNDDLILLADILQTPIKKRCRSFIVGICTATGNHNSLNHQRHPYCILTYFRLEYNTLI